MTTETTTETTQAATEDKVLALAELITAHEQGAAELKAEAAKHTAAADSFKAELRKLLDLGKHKFGNFQIAITGPSRSFDTDAFMAAYPIELNPALYKPVINTEAVPPALKNQFMKAGSGDPKVSIK